jgi:hypothetical protein
MPNAGTCMMLRECSIRCHQDVKCNHIGTCEMWTSPEVTGTILTNASGRCMTKLWHFCGVLNACASVV